MSKRPKSYPMGTRDTIKLVLLLLFVVLLMLFGLAMEFAKFAALLRYVFGG